MIFFRINILKVVVCIFSIALLNACARTGQTHKSVQLVTPVVEKLQTAVPVYDVNSLGGFWGERSQKNKDNYLKKFPIDEHVAFLEERTYRDWDWRKAEQPGKWLESAILTAKRTGDKELEQKARQMFERLINSQEPEGYIGATDPAVRTPEKPLRGMDAYELYFLHHALMTAWEEWHDQRALGAAVKLAGYFVKYIGPGKAEFWPSSDRYPDNVGKVYRGTVHSDLAGHALHYSWEGTLLIDPMLRLYTLTGDKQYLDWSLWTISNIDKWSGWNAFSNLDKVADGSMKVNEIQPYVHAHTFQMNFLGFLRLYQISGDQSYLKKVAAVWDDVAERQMYITGGVAVGEHYEKDYIKPLTGKMVETCATMSWLEMSNYLLELTNNTKYADAMERLIWNHVFAAQTIDGDCNRYDTPPNGFKPEGYFHGPDCCTASGHRLQSILPKFIYATGEGNSLYINQFVKSTAELDLGKKGKVVIIQETDFPQEAVSVLTINPAAAAEITIKVRIPSWCELPEIKVNGSSVLAVPGQYAVISRKWKKGDRIEISLPMQLRWVRRQHHMKVSDRKPYPAEPDNDPPYALLRGPVVYALDNIWYEGDTASFPKKIWEDAKYILQDPTTFEKVERPAAHLLGPGYLIPIQLSDDKVITMPIYPFANIGKWYKHENNKPEVDSEAYSYAVWIKGMVRNK